MPHGDTSTVSQYFKVAFEDWRYGVRLRKINILQHLFAVKSKPSFFHNPQEPKWIDLPRF